MRQPLVPFLVPVVVVLLGSGLLAGCASKVSVEIREPIAGSPTVAEARKDPAAHLGAPVRWGGTIAQVRNREGVTEIEVVARPLDHEGRPQQVDRSTGRFLARIEGFLDPAIYTQGRELTVNGLLQEAVERAIGEYAYRFPVVEVRAHYLWGPRAERRDRPYYDPWHPHPWYRPYHPFNHPYW